MATSLKGSLHELPSNGLTPLVRLAIWLLSIALYFVLAYGAGKWAPIILAYLLLALYLMPRLNTAFFVFLLFMPHFGGDRLPILTHSWMLFYLILLLSWSYHVVRLPSRIYLNIPLGALFSIYILLCVLSLVGGYDATSMPVLEVEHMPGPWVRILDFFLAASLFILAMSAFENEEQLRRILWLIVLTGVPMAITIIFSKPETAWEAGALLGRRWGIFTMVHAAASHMLVCTIFAGALYLSTRDRKLRWLLLACAVLFMMLQMVTASKGVIATIPVICFIGLVVLSGWKRALMISVPIVTAPLLLYPLLPEQLQEIIAILLKAILTETNADLIRSGQDPGSFAARIDHIRVAFEMLESDPLLGVGAGVHMWLENAPAPVGPMLHVYYAAIMAETGYLGLTAFLILLGAVVWIGTCTVREARRRHDPSVFHLTLGLLLAFLAVLCILLSQPGYTECERHLWVIGGLIAVAPRLLQRTDRIHTFSRTAGVR